MRLSKDQIREILIAHSHGEEKAVIAARHKIDVSTVRYHVDAFENSYSTTERIYALVRPVQVACHHPSLKCLVCGQANDNLRRRELETIATLKEQLARANATLTHLGYEEITGV
jgi:catalase